MLTVALDTESRTVTQAGGRYNAVPNQPPRSARAKQEMPSGYFNLLNRSNTILNRWIKRERLRRD